MEGFSAKYILEETFYGDVDLFRRHVGILLDRLLYCVHAILSYVRQFTQRLEPLRMS